MQLGSPVEAISDSVGSAIHVDLSDIVYEGYDYNSVSEYKQARINNSLKVVTKTRRPQRYDIVVEAMFPQIWGSAALGFSGIGGAAMTPAYTVIISCKGEYAVYFDGRFAYKLINPNDKFFEDIKSTCMAPVSGKDIYCRS